MSAKGLLVVTRRVKEAVKITTPTGDVIEIGVFQIKGHQARIGFKCSKEFKIERIDGVSRRDVRHEREE